MRLAILVAAIVALHRNVLAEPTAEALFDEGQTAYDHGDYALAVERWQEAYRVSKEPALLFNLAQAYRLASDCEHALASYQQFIAIDPASEQRTLAEELAHELESKCGLSTKAPLVEPPSTPSQSGNQLKVVGVATGGAGAVSVVVGLALGHHGRTLGDEVTRACAVACDWSAQKSSDAAGRRDVAIGYALDGLGAVAIVGGALLYYLGERQSGLSVSRPREGGANISWSGSW